MPHIRRLYDELLTTLSVLQIENHEIVTSGGKKKLNKSLSSFPCGYINVEEVASVALRLLRVNSSSSPKQVRADKKLYDELVQTHLKDLHCLAWKVVTFLFENVEMGTEVFERELAGLTRDQIKSDLKDGESTIGKGSERALEQLSHLIRSPSSFNGQVFVSEMIRSGILVEVSSKATRSFCGLLRSGVNKASSFDQQQQHKKARYHQVSESDQKRLETAQSAFASDLSKVFASLAQTFVVFESIQANLSPQDHVTMTENVLNSIASLLQSQHNYKFIPEVCEGEYLRVLVNSLTHTLVSFQPAYLPPFLPLAMRLLGLIAGRIDTCGSAARRALMQAELLIHPRRLGPVTFRVASEAIVKVFERPEPICEEAVKDEDALESDKPAVTNLTSIPKISEPEPIVTNPESVNKIIEKPANPIIEDLVIPTIEQPIEEPFAQKYQHIPPVTTPQPPAPLAKRSLAIEDDDDDDDDLPLPQIIDSGPDEL